MPNLRELKLSNSVIGSLRDLGIGLVNLQILWVDKCGLTSLDGIIAMPELKELYASFNDIIELSPLNLHDKIEILDLDSNGVKDINEVLQLISCNSLISLNLDGNPVTSIENYRWLVINYIVQLQTLDDIDITDNDKKQARNVNTNFEKNLEEDNIRPDIEEEIMIAEGIKQCLSSSLKSRSYIMGSPTKRVIKYNESLKGIYERPRTALGLEQQSLTNSLHRDPTTGSDLTHGGDSSIVGNPIMGLRKRRAAV